MDACDRGDLPVDERRCFAARNEASTLGGMPLCSGAVIVEDRHCLQNDIVKVARDSIAAPRGWQTLEAESQFVPHDGRNCDLFFVASKPAQNSVPGCRSERFRHDVRVEKVLQTHRPDSLPGVMSRTSAKTSSGSMSRAVRSTPVVKSAQASEKRRDRETSRSYSFWPINTATRWPRRVSSTALPDSASRISFGRFVRASAIECCFVIRKLNVHRRVHNTSSSAMSQFR